MAANGSIRVDGALVRDDDALVAALKAGIARGKGKTRVSLRCAPSLPIQKVHHVIELCHKLGIEDVSFAVLP